MPVSLPACLLDVLWRGLYAEGEDAVERHEAMMETAEAN